MKLGTASTPVPVRRPRIALHGALATILAGFAAAGADDGRPIAPDGSATSDSPAVLTLLDYFGSGQKAVDAFVEACVGGGTAPGLGESIRRVMPATARIEVRRFGGDGGFATAIASGVLVDGGRRLYTAGHSFVGLGDGVVLVTLPSGDTRPARLLDHRYDPDTHEDWAVLELDAPYGRSVEVGGLRRTRPGDLVFVLGYPDRIGIDAAGQVAYCPGSEPAYREPLTLLAEVRSVRPLRLSPKAGAIPIGGMSGGPVFDTEGRLIGVFSSISRIEMDGEISHAFNGSPLPSRPPVLSRGDQR